jgi:hypothetical protein
MSTQRKRYSAEFKARVALEALKGLKTVNELKHGQNISYMDAEMIGSYFEEMLQTLRPFSLATLELFITSPRQIFGSKQDPFISALA